ncbi:MAG TPA: glycosyltransferase [Anaerolineaceae bacterium]|nr:glycosyltransferase [Anaerolineaceae bacterium]
MARKIALISEHASPLAQLGGVDFGGQNVYVAHVAQQLALNGFVVDVFTRRDDPSRPVVYPWDNNIRVIHVPAGPARFIRKEELAQYMDEFTEFVDDFIGKEEIPYDLIHANFWMSGLVAAELKKRRQIPFVITFHALGKVRRLHQGKADGFPDERFDVEERLVREADHIIAECPQDEDDLLLLYNADPEKITIIPCGFDPEEFWPIEKSQARKRLKLDQRERIILQLGRIVPRKGIETVIRALGELQRQYNVRSQLIVVGGESDQPDPQITPEIGRLQAIAEEEGVLDAVKFVGRKSRRELKYFYSAADVFVTTPWYEPFGMTPLEAMACGTPVIGSMVGGIKYTIADGETGYLIPPKDSEKLAERLNILFKNPKLLEKFGMQAVLRTNEHFTWTRVTRSIAQLFETIIGKGETVASSETSQAAIIEFGFENAAATVQKSHETLSRLIQLAGEELIACLARGNKVLVCGNGGSAADAQHFAAEFVGRFKMAERRALPVLALNTDTSILTAWANDVSFDSVFARQIEAFGAQGDLLVEISTSGQSKNLIQAFQAAHSRSMTCIALLGADGGELLPMADIAIVVPAIDKARIQEIHILILHLLSELVEGYFASLGVPTENRIPRMGSTWNEADGEINQVKVNNQKGQG